MAWLNFTELDKAVDHVIRLVSFLIVVSHFSLPSDAVSHHLPSYLGFSYLGCGVSLHGCSSKAQPLLLTLDEGYLLTAAPPDLEHGTYFPGGSDGKASAYSAGDPGSIPGSGRSPREVNGNPLQYSCPQEY